MRNHFKHSVELPGPLGSDPDITFLSGVTSDATVAPISYGTWTKLNQNPPSYDPVLSSFTFKWDSTTLLPEGTPGGNVTYWFDTLLLPHRMTLRTEPPRQRQASARQADLLRIAISCRERQGDQRCNPTYDPRMCISQLASPPDETSHGRCLAVLM